MNTKRSLIDQLQQSLTEAKQQVEQLVTTRTALAAQIDRTEAKRSELRSLIEQKKAAQMRAMALSGVHGASGSVFNAEAIIERVRQETEVAQGKAEATSFTLDARIQEVIGGDDVEMQLREREERLHRLPSTPADAPSPPPAD
jgi:phage shock protein A